MSDQDNITRIKMLMSLEVVPFETHRHLGGTFILHEKDEDEYFRKHGKSWKGMNRLIRKCIGRLNP